MASSTATSQAVIEVDKVSTRFGDHVVHTDISLQVSRAEIFALIGGSGSGKSTLLREIILLHRPDAGSIRVLGVELTRATDAEGSALRRRWGVMFQHGGLFGALTVKENIGLPLREHTDLDDALIDEIAMAKLAMTGLAPEVGAQYPSQLSGGMMKRASLARALALDPELLFLDEPTAGLDPIGAAAFDALTRELQETLGLTVFLITHDLDTLYEICDRVAVLADKQVIAVGTIPELLALDHPWIQEYFNGPRGRAAKASIDRAKGMDNPQERGA